MITRILRRFVLVAAGLAAALAGGAPGAARADFLLSSGGSGGPGFSQPDLTVGYAFTVGAQPVEVTRLGLLDLHLPAATVSGLFEAHEVGLWTSTGTLLGSVTVPAGTAAPLINGFRFAALSTPVILDPLQTYVLGAHYATAATSNINADIFRSNTPTQMAAIMSSQFTFTGGRASFGFTFPALVIPNGQVGPNLEFQPVPEPATVVSLGSGLVMLAGSGWRRRRGRPVATA